ncbi:peptidoglycan D,D-transpeptidase FtsI family protein [Elusimicrobiota bacterium]
MLNVLRLALPLLIIFFAFFASIVRLGQLQLFMHESLTKKTSRELTRRVHEQKTRGDIFDRSGRLLATSLERPSIFILRKDLKIPHQILLDELKKNLSGISIGDIKNRLKKSSNYILVKRDATKKDARKVRAMDIKGVYIEQRLRRFNPYSKVAVNIIGSVGTDGEGLFGIEHVLDDLLTSKTQTKIVLKDALGKAFAQEEVHMPLKKKRSFSGPLDLYLTIDTNLQSIIEERLAKVVEENNAKLGIIVVENAQTGEILSMANIANPKFASSLKKVDPNYAVSYTFEPGSVLKPMIMAIALNTGSITPDSEFFCENGKYRIAKNVTIKDHEPYGMLTVREILMHSSNICMVKIAMSTGDNNMFNNLKAFGFGIKTALPVTGEAIGILTAPAHWSAISLSSLSFGQEIGVTAIQLVNAYAAIANGGKLIEPRLISKIKSPKQDKNIFPAEFQVIRNVISPSVAGTTLDFMKDVIETGTGINAKIPGRLAAGKTGTAQKYDHEIKKYSDKTVTVSFCGAVPLPDPKLAICVIVDEPMLSTPAWASEIAAPLFKEVAMDAMHFISFM